MSLPSYYYNSVYNDDNTNNGNSSGNSDDQQQQQQQHLSLQFKYTHEKKELIEINNRLEKYIKIVRY